MILSDQSKNSPSVKRIATKTSCGYRLGEDKLSTFRANSYLIHLEFIGCDTVSLRSTNKCTEGLNQRASFWV